MTERPQNDMYRGLAQGLTLRNDQRREYACEMMEDADTDEPLIIEFAANSKVILEEDGTGAYVTCVIWVPNPNRPDEEEETEEEDDDGD